MTPQTIWFKVESGERLYPPVQSIPLPKKGPVKQVPYDRSKIYTDIKQGMELSKWLRHLAPNDIPFCFAYLADTANAVRPRGGEEVHIEFPADRALRLADKAHRERVMDEYEALAKIHRQEFEEKFDRWLRFRPNDEFNNYRDQRPNKFRPPLANMEMPHAIQ